MNIHFIQHAEFEGPGLIQNWLMMRGYQSQITAAYLSGVAFPEPSDFDALIVLGGPMSANDHLVWLELERLCIQAAIDADKPVLGICLGAQLIAQVLGAEVSPVSQPEMGWYPIALRDQALGHPLLRGLNYAMTVFHWHGEGFMVPKGATLIASSQGHINQGFVYKQKVLALQFHLEMDGDGLLALVQADYNPLVSGPYIQGVRQMLAGTKRYHLQQTLTTLLDNWIATQANT